MHRDTETTYQTCPCLPNQHPKEMLLTNRLCLGLWRPLSSQTASAEEDKTLKLSESLQITSHQNQADADPILPANRIHRYITACKLSLAIETKEEIIRS